MYLIGMIQRLSDVPKKNKQTNEGSIRTQNTLSSVYKKRKWNSSLLLKIFLSISNKIRSDINKLHAQT